MPNLITGSERAAYESARDDIFLTFARPFVYYRTPETTIIDSNTNYKFSYGIQPEGVNDVDYTSYNIQSGIFSGCIQYANTLDKIFSNPQGSRNENFRVTMDMGMVRLKVLLADFDNYLKNTQTLTLDGKQFNVVRTERPHGVFSPKYYTLYLQYQN